MNAVSNLSTPLNLSALPLDSYFRRDDMYVEVRGPLLETTPELNPNPKLESL